ncbi:class I tRNA ligase family protein [Roseateles sp.]|uniref:class I tRNA ligase family protein n=1 Tax=Roseateles sp. TaxID=1971397 RepID=UPI003D1108D6
MHYQSICHEFEAKWRDRWLAAGTYATPNPGEAGFDPSKPKYVVLDFFPFPSGAGLHVGHPVGYIATDVLARTRRLQGYNVLHAMGYDAFGLPAEQYALQTGTHPAKTTADNIAQIKKQLGLMGLALDPRREFSTTDPEYYHWTQWIFLKLYDSFYDPTVEWTGPDGVHNLGRARPLGELRSLLESGAWSLDADGKAAPVPASEGGAGPDEAAMTRALDAARLAQIAQEPVNWCPGLGTVLANEEVTKDGRSERGDFPVHRRPLKQVVLKITAYAERLLADLRHVEWPEGVVQMQRNWIGRSEGATIRFALRGRADTLSIYTTKPATLPGVRAIVIAPDHPLAPDASKLAATSGVDADEMVGAKTDLVALHPLTGEELSVWTGNFVLADYGDGAVMCVPAHDERDFAFARKYDLDARPVVVPPQAWLREHAPHLATLPDDALAAAYLEHCLGFNAAFTEENVPLLDASATLLRATPGQMLGEAHAAAIREVERVGAGTGQVHFRLRDWLFSRQRYWGEPFPLVHGEDGRVHALHESVLPVRLPDLVNFEPETNQPPESEPQPPLARASEWLHLNGVVLDDGRVLPVEAPVGTTVSQDGRDRPVRRFRRESNTMPNWAGSCWYYLRYADPANPAAAIGDQAQAYWGGREGEHAARGFVDMYVGGTEHAVLHLLYARFWHKFLYDIGEVSSCEPFKRLFNQGMITADAYKDDRGFYVDYHDVVVEQQGATRVARHKDTGAELEIVGGKMGKRYKNGIAPEEVFADFSVDAFRLHILYLGPLEAHKEWSSAGLVGMYRFLASFWELCVSSLPDATVDPASGKDIEAVVARTIVKVTDDIAGMRFNTAVAALIKAVAALKKFPAVPRAALMNLVHLLAPFAPHMAEELFERLGGTGAGIFSSAWPVPPDDIPEETVPLVVSFNGKKALVLESSEAFAGMSGEEIAQRLLEGNERLRHLAAGRAVRKAILVGDPPKMLNIVL